MPVPKLIVFLALSTLLLAPEIARGGDIDIQTNNSRVVVGDDGVAISSGRAYSTRSGLLNMRRPIYRPRPWYLPRARAACNTQQRTYTSSTSRGSVYTRSSTSTSVCRSYTAR